MKKSRGHPCPNAMTGTGNRCHATAVAINRAWDIPAKTPQGTFHALSCRREVSGLSPHALPHGVEYSFGIADTRSLVVRGFGSDPLDVDGAIPSVCVTPADRIGRG